MSKELNTNELVEWEVFCRNKRVMFRVGVQSFTLAYEPEDEPGMSASQQAEWMANQLGAALGKLASNQSVSIEPVAHVIDHDDAESIIDCHLPIGAQLYADAPSKAGEWTDEQILKLADDFGIDYDGSFYRNPDEDKANFLEFARALLSAPAQAKSEGARDAARYRWLKMHSEFSQTDMSFHIRPVKHRWHLGAHEEIDAAIDAALAKEQG